MLFAYSARNFAKLSFSYVTEFRNASYQGYVVKGLNLFSRLREIVEKGLEHLFIISSSSHFFTKTNLEQYLYIGITIFVIDVIQGESK